MHFLAEFLLGYGQNPRVNRLVAVIHPNQSSGGGKDPMALHHCMHA
jgi:hypothetical protein